MSNYMALFCEDIREEIGGTHTIVGVMPDNINIEATPNAGEKILFPKLGFYARLFLDTDRQPKGDVEVRVRLPSVPELLLGKMEEQAINQAYLDAKRNGMPTVGLIFKGVAQGLTLSVSGQGTITALIESKEHVCGVLNINIPAKPVTPGG